MNESLIKLAAVIAVATGLAFGAAWLHNTLAERHYQPTIDKLNDTLGSVRQLNKSLVSQLQAQNAAIASMAAESAKDKQRIADLEKAAQLAAGDEYGKANEVLQERTVDTDVCRAASSAFDNELRKERTK